MTSSSLVMIPTYNEIENVEKIVSGISALNLDLDILFVDDNSPDGTGKLLDKLAGEYSRMKVLHRPGKLGIGSAHMAGIAWAYEHGYQRLLTMDSDLTHAPRDIARMLEARGDADVVVGSRYMNPGCLKDWDWHRKFMSHTGHFLTTLLLGLPQDCTNAFRLYRIDRIPHGLFKMVQSKSYSFFYESLHRLNINKFKISEISIDLPARTYGHSKMRLADIVYSFKFLWKLGWQTRFARSSLIYVPPFDGIDTGDMAQEQWDKYWSGGSGHEGKWLYDLVAAAYRRFIIRPAVDHFLGNKFSSGDKLLHAGCGSGMVDTNVSRCFDIVGFDISPRALIEYARNHDGKADLLQGSLLEIPAADGSYDGVFNLGVMEHFTERDIHLILLEFLRVVKADGRIVLFWPPEYGLATRALKVIHWIIHNVFKKDIVLHPEEITRVTSRAQIEKILNAAGWELENFYFGPRDAFTHAIIVGRKAAEPSRAEKIAETSGSEKAIAESLA